jgi:hypothetical protein
MNDNPFQIDYSKNRNRSVETGKPGKPPKYGSAAELESECDLYFEQIEKAGEPPLITGLALFLGFANRSSLRNYEAIDDEYSRVIKRAIETVGMHRERVSLNPAGQVAGSLFWLKNHGWDAEQKQQIKYEGYEINIPEPSAPKLDVDDETDPY